jgi:hypothetical protein
MNAGNERKPDDPENQTPPANESGELRPSPAVAGEPDLSRRSPAGVGEAAPEGECYCFEVNASPAFPFYESPARPVVADALAEFLAAKS